jgi:uncharacterized surface protein with fasciclin (FAS1) repeats
MMENWKKEKQNENTVRSEMMKRTLILSTILVLLVVAVAPVAAAPAYQAEADIVDIAVADGRFTTLVTAVQAAGLVDTLKGEGPFTVFAPTDDAFGKLPEGTIDALLNDIPTLTDILLYHVVPGKVMAADVVDLSSATTALGKDVSIKVEGGNVMINDAQVVITDIEASNGVIHVIDTVILPPADAPATLPESGGAPSYGTFLLLLGLGAAMLLGGVALRLRTASVSQ